jgi:cholesterol oxidase
MYAPLYEHDQLNRQTHATLHETFGIANTAAFEHLALLVREGHLVDARGNEAYMPHLERLAIPIHFIHGSENTCFLPKSTELTVERLSRVNDPRLYSRDVIPRYGHIDCIMGENAVRDVFPRIARHLDDTGRSAAWSTLRRGCDRAYGSRTARSVGSRLSYFSGADATGRTSGRYLPDC